MIRQKVISYLEANQSYGIRIFIHETLKELPISNFLYQINSAKMDKTHKQTHDKLTNYMCDFVMWAEIEKIDFVTSFFEIFLHGAYHYQVDSTSQ